MRFNLEFWSVLWSLTIGGSLLGTTLPENQDPFYAKKGPSPFDPGLQTWLNNFAVPDSSASEVRTAGLDATTAAFIDLMSSKGRPKADLLDHEKLDPSHVLYPYYLEELGSHFKDQDEKADLLATKLFQLGTRSCPERDIWLRRIDDVVEERSLEENKDILANILAFKSRRFRIRALDAFLDTLPEEHQGALKEPLFEALKDIPSLLDDNDWLTSGSSDETTTDSSESSLALLDARRAASKLRCDTAKRHFLEAIRAKNTDIKSVERTAYLIGGCYRRKGPKPRVRFWESIEKPLEEVFGFDGFELAHRKRALILWGQDGFDAARNLFKELLERAKKEKAPHIEGRSLHTLARIEENEGDFKEALELYKAFVEQFPDAEEVEESLKSMIVLNFHLGNIPETIRIGNELIRSETMKSMDERDSTILGYALFWTGRAYYLNGKLGMAQEMWRRVATEFYSTFYGAMGHYLLEKLVGKTLNLQPERVRNFEAETVSSAFPETEQLRIKRVETLLRIGMKEEAACELSELNVDPERNMQRLWRVLYRHASGDWLEAIKEYGNLPRSFRQSLPRGMERVLFPRAYEDYVVSYAKKLDVDPDFIFALIRQESVYNPRAQSPVGASGLMQLMPRTASLEARRVKRTDYLTKQSRRHLKKSWKSYIFDEETNIALGVHHVYRLFQRYKSPILVLSAYNASPSAAERWRKNIAVDDPLVFIERIPYAETRAYVKLVLRNYFYYKRWYRGVEQPLPHLELLAPQKLAQIEPKTMKK